MKARVYTDGASKGNPGEGGIGVVILSPAGETLSELGEYIGEVTNNVAEYRAFIRGLEEALRLGIKEVSLFVDSELLFRQIKGSYRVRDEKLLPLHRKAKELLGRFKSAEVVLVPREENRRADQLANISIKRRKEEENAKVAHPPGN